MLDVDLDKMWDEHKQKMQTKKYKMWSTSNNE
jgi:hypothetical protein